MRAKYHGHATISIQTESRHKILVDPFITGNSLSDLDPEQVEANFIILTHGHDDHVGDTVAIAKRTGALVIAPVELANYLAEQGLETYGMNLGGYHDFEFGRVKYVQAFHSSATMVDGKQVYLGPASGVLITADEQTIYHVGDTALFSDLKLIGDTHEIDLAFIPIGSNFTMGPEDAKIAAEWINAKRAIPIHYNTFPPIQQDAQAYVDSLPAGMGYLPETGAWIELD